jgi:hypothetical protein
MVSSRGGLLLATKWRKKPSPAKALAILLRNAAGLGKVIKVPGPLGIDGLKTRVLSRLPFVPPAVASPVLGKFQVELVSSNS